ncbi:hypothetical protein H257_11348 [Aphanomyces astaci]|uniref:COX assembly mitochondrial protein n=1 Tax=Aphanomyces astaci TaxID=112090 RepID=W4G434_APHAT|nr:hypothetical protein H257_11348 [Aphanomyces astaci]ETV74036.1 hypothetical protein H257_11348 [Aphanomyces astaci]|eukprot:XP_009836549.1 hypothetical protein H257_11348 [Aphanomyces astaci]
MSTEATPTVDEAKTEWRSGRLQWSNQAEHKLKQELNATALAKCRDRTSAFHECSKEHGLMVVFKCREQNHALNECLHEYTSKEALEALKAAKVNDIPVVIKEVPRKKYFEQ